MADTWFRFYNGAVNDPKVQRLPPTLFRFWVNVLCLASANAGTLPALEDMEFTLRISANQLSEFIGKLVSSGLLEQNGETFQPHNWNVRQFKSDGSTERVKRFRERSSNATVTANETGPETEQIQSRTEQNTTEGCFVDFFNSMPRKMGKVPAKVAYSAAILKTSPEIILGAAKKYTVATKGFEDRYILSPAKWLDDERWTDFANGHSNSAFKSPEEIEGQRKMKEKYGVLEEN